ncbi:MAG TPA: hypothetical protein VHW72_01300 [Candidatus Angelobacter sp.]|jgi:hypothetical protein|nr:hypothetical protein [Candidatus Angelobacter sp.]
MTDGEKYQELQRLARESEETERDLVLLERSGEGIAEALRCLAVFIKSASDRQANFKVDPKNLPQPFDVLEAATVDKVIELAREIERTRARLRRLHAQKDEAGLK